MFYPVSVQQASDPELDERSGKERKDYWESVRGAKICQL